MEYVNFILEQLLVWWQFTIVGVLVIIGWIINLFGVDNKKEIIGFSKLREQTLLSLRDLYLMALLYLSFLQLGYHQLVYFWLVVWCMIMHTNIKDY